MQPVMLTEAPEYQSSFTEGARLISAVEFDAEREREELQAANEPLIAGLQTERRFAMDARAELLILMAGISVLPRSLATQVINFLKAVFLSLATFALTDLAIVPFDWGPFGHVFCAGLTLAAPLSAHYVLSRDRRHHKRRIFVAVAFLCSCTTYLVLSELRSQQRLRELGTEDGVVFEDVLVPPVSRGVEEDEQLVRWLMIVGTAALECSAALAWDAYARSLKPTNVLLYWRLHRQLLKKEQRVAALDVEIHRLMSGPARRYAARRRAVRQGLLDGITKGSRESRFLMILLFAALGSAARAADSLDVMLALDATQTQMTLGLKGSSEFEENRLAVGRILASLPTGAHVAAAVVTERSSPSVLLDARLSSDSGYLGSKLQAGRRRLVNEWDSRTKSLMPSAPHTDLFGFLQNAAENLGRSTASRRVIVFLSDMRNDVGVNLERPLVIDVTGSIEEAQKRRLIPDLADIEIIAVGIGEHAGQRSAEYNASLREFWVEFFRRSGATLKVFSATRDADALRAVTFLPQSEERR